MSREAAVTALQTLVAGAYPWVTGPSRRLKLWTEVPLAARPACFMFEGGAESYAWQQSVTPKRIHEVRLFIYVNAKDPNIIGATQLNNIMDALDAALAPKPGQSQQTLAGTGAWARIDGTPAIDPGDLDGDAMLIVPIKITLP